jgi:TonB family protein
MRVAVVYAALVVLPVVLGGAPALSQDFSITNELPPVDAGRRGVLRQLQAWWDVHGYYPRHAAENDEGGTVKLRLTIRADGNIAQVETTDSAGSPSLDSAAVATFRGGFVRPLTAATTDTTIDLALHYVLTRRPGQPAAPGATQAGSARPFTITNEPVTSPVVDTMLQRTCTGTVVKQGIRNHPAYGIRNAAEAIFFRRPDGSPWVKFYEGGFGTLAPVVEVGKIVKWAGRKEYLAAGVSSFTEYTVWADDNNNLNGSIEIKYSAEARFNQLINRGGTIDLSCASAVVPAVNWSASSVTPESSPSGDPP